MLIALACVAPLAAQQPDSAKRMPHPGMGRRGMMMQHPDMGMDEMMMMGDSTMMRVMMGSMAYMPQHLLALKDTLKLTADQVTSLNGIVQRAKAARDAALAAARPHLEEMAEAKDTADMKHHFTAAHDAMGQAHWAMISAAAQAKVVLTAAQRAQVQALVDSKHAHMRARHSEMMERHN
jgi:hypothetical protein